jgi:hypothetical protein
MYMLDLSPNWKNVGGRSCIHMMESIQSKNQLRYIS